MKFHVTMGQAYTHSVVGKTIDKDCVVEIEAENYDKARTIAFEVFGGKFCSMYEEIPNMSFYPRGIIKI